jgi:diadenosine tetraphosphate (Ap4A) HIT family hydrolase
MMRNVALAIKSGRTEQRWKRVGKTECLFCRWNDRSINRILVDNHTFYVRHDNFPATEGHVEVVPKRHVESFFDLNPGELTDFYSLIRAARAKLAETVEQAPEGYTIGVNEGRAAGRTIHHLHVHLIPRRRGDVDDPRGGIRQIFPNCEPDAWISTGRDSQDSNRELAASARPGT